MIRVLQFSRPLPGCRRLLHHLKSQELDQSAFHKKPLDPKILSLVKKYEQDILYTSHIELNKIPLTYKQRMNLLKSLAKQKVKGLYDAEREPGQSVIVEKIAKLTESKHKHDVTQPVVEEEPSIIPTETKIAVNDHDKLLLAKSKLQILTEMGLRRSAIDHETQSFPDNWMEDYETFDESDILADTRYGTADPNVPISKVPCHGCGSLLQCADTSLPGYLPSELMNGHEKKVLTRLICQRCHFLKNYNTALKVQVNAEDYISMISKIKDQKALAIVMVDLVDMPCSIWPNLVEIIGEERPVIVVGNKIDLLPQDSREYLSHITKCLEDTLIKSGLSKANIVHTCLISAETHFGIEGLITKLYDIWSNKGDVYLLGNANVGKSTLFNALLRSDYCKIRARNLIRRATSSLWPGTTLRMLKFPISRPSSALLYERNKRLQKEERRNWELENLMKDQVFTGRKADATLMEHLGQTFELFDAKTESVLQLTDAPPDEKYFNENHKTFKAGKWLYDTPGVIQNEQIINLLTSEELLYTIPKCTLWPRVFYMIPGQTLFLSGLGRIDYLGGSSRMRLAVYASEKLSILIVNTHKADEIYQEFLGTELLNVPRGDEERIHAWPQLKRHDEKISFGNYHNGFNESIGDIVFSSAGWVSVNVLQTESAHFYAWTPEQRGLNIRKPSLLPYAAAVYRGKRNIFTPAYKQIEPKSVRKANFDHQFE